MIDCASGRSAPALFSRFPQPYFADDFAVRTSDSNDHDEHHRHADQQCDGLANNNKNNNNNNNNKRNDDEEDDTAQHVDAAYLAGRFDVLDIVGSGAHATVYSAYDRIWARPVALKVLRKSRPGYSSAPRAARGATAPARTSTTTTTPAPSPAPATHPNIVAFHAHYETPAAAVLVQELVAGGELFAYATSSGSTAATTTCGVGETAARACARDAAAALRHLHGRGVAHGDVKLENLVVDVGDEEGEVDGVVSVVAAMDAAANAAGAVGDEASDSEEDDDEDDDGEGGCYDGRAAGLSRASSAATFCTAPSPAQPAVSSLPGAALPPIHVTEGEPRRRRRRLRRRPSPPRGRAAVSGGVGIADATKLDTYALGCVLYALLTGFLPPAPSTSSSSSGLDDDALLFPSPWCDGVSGGARAAVRACLAREPAARCSADEFLRLPWVVTGGGSARAVLRATARAGGDRGARAAAAGQRDDGGRCLWRRSAGRLRRLLLRRRLRRKGAGGGVVPRVLVKAPQDFAAAAVLAGPRHHDKHCWATGVVAAWQEGSEEDSYGIGGCDDDVVVDDDCDGDGDWDDGEQPLWALMEGDSGGEEAVLAC
ncbi:hypothetical protein DFJ73DRAFT_797684 [Zopfochytrium polystomum]|nr:hypothetical protein DFJ73DRAFT_797684 [Zopfochytrium polystomum]